jgi:hypothetical protein
MMAVGQILITKRQAFDSDVANNLCKNGKKKNTTILNTDKTKT